MHAMKRKMAKDSTLYQMSVLYGCTENIYNYVCVYTYDREQLVKN